MWVIDGCLLDNILHLKQSVLKNGKIEGLGQATLLHLLATFCSAAQEKTCQNEDAQS